MGSLNKKTTLVRLFIVLSFIASSLAASISQYDHCPLAVLEGTCAESESLSSQKIEPLEESPHLNYLRLDSIFPKIVSLHSVLTVFQSNSCHRLTSIINFSRPPPVILPS